MDMTGRHDQGQYDWNPPPGRTLLNNQRIINGSMMNSKINIGCLLVYPSGNQT